MGTEVDHARRCKLRIQGLYHENGDRAGFWVQHRSWQNLCAQIISIGGCASGPLPEILLGADEATLMFDTYDVSSGRRATPHRILRHGPVRDYRRIAQPPWARDSG